MTNIPSLLSSIWSPWPAFSSHGGSPDCDFGEDRLVFSFFSTLKFLAKSLRGGECSGKDSSLSNKLCAVEKAHTDEEATYQNGARFLSFF